jgi:phosphoserine phosphatase RsbU/P
MDASKPLIGVLDEPGDYRDALADTIARDGLAVLAAEKLEDLPAETVLVVAHARTVPSLEWASLTERLPTVVVSDSRLDADLLTAVDVGLVDYVVEPMRHGQLLRRMIRKAIELHRLEEERARDRERLAELNESLETHLALLRLDQQAGGQIQRKLLPPRSQTLGGVTCDYWLVPSLYLSGDFLDFQRFNDRFTLFYFADVSGHGASSAFVTVLLKYLCNRWLGEWDGNDPDRLPANWLTALNRELLDTGIGKHATLFVGVIDHCDHCLHYSLGAQLPKPLLVADGQIVELPGEGMPVGLFPNVEYPRLRYGLPSNFRLWLCSDGVLECLPGETLDMRLRELKQRVLTCTTLEQLLDGLALDLSPGIGVEGGFPDQELLDDLTIMMLSGFADDHS